VARYSHYVINNNLDAHLNMSTRGRNGIFDHLILLFCYIQRIGHQPFGKLDRAVYATYSMSRDEDILSFLLKLNLQLHEKEASGETIVGPGLPPGFDVHRFISLDCVSVS
jgi:hypothetical protein